MYVNPLHSNNLNTDKHTCILTFNNMYLYECKTKLYL